MQCQHAAVNSAGSPRVCPQMATQVQIVEYPPPTEGGTPLVQPYYWCAAHAGDHTTYPNGTVLTPDADGMVTIQ